MQLQVEIGLENNIAHSFQEFADKQSTLAIVFFEDQVQISWRLKDRNVWSEVIALPWVEGKLPERQLANFSKFTTNIVREGCAVKVAYSSQVYTLVPSELFSEAKKLDLYIKNTGSNIPVGNLLTSNFIPALNSYIIYAVPAAVKRLLETRLPSYELFHAKQAALAGMKEKAQGAKNFLNLNFGGDHFDIAIFGLGKVLFFNSFNLISTEDILYYLLFVAEKLGYGLNDFTIQLFGEIPKLVDKELLEKHLPISADFSVAEEYVSLKNLPNCV